MVEAKHEVSKVIMGNAMRKSLLVAFLTAVFICGFALGGALFFSMTKASTDGTGVIQASTELEPIPKPSVPEFTVELVDSSYDVPTTYTIDPYTGENVTHPSYHVESTSIEVKIKNQPFVSYYDASRGWTINFYYNVRLKGHFQKIGLSFTVLQMGIQLSQIHTIQ